jgi:hypothetical protein
LFKIFNRGHTVLKNKRRVAAGGEVQQAPAAAVVPDQHDGRVTSTVAGGRARSRRQREGQRKRAHRAAVQRAAPLRRGHLPRESKGEVKTERAKEEAKPARRRPWRRMTDRWQ